MLKLKDFVFVVLILTFFLTGIRAAEPYSLSDDVVVFDLWRFFDEAKLETIEERANALYFITALQGLANRDAPKLYLDASLVLFDVETTHYYNPDYRKKPVRELDQYWLKYFEQQGYFQNIHLKRTSRLDELLSVYQQYYDGLVLWTMAVPATSNLALTAAGCESLLPVSKDLDGDRFYAYLDSLKQPLPVKLDLTQKFDGRNSIIVDGVTFPGTLSAKNDCYKYLIEKYLRPGLANPFKMWYNCDASMLGKFRSHYAQKDFGYLGDRNELQHNGMYNADYWVAQKAVFFDLYPWPDSVPADDPGQTLGADHKTWNDLLEVSYHLRKGEFGIVGGFVPWWIKYTSHTGAKHDPVPTEWEFVSLLSSYNMGNDADAAFGIANASFFQHLPSVSAEQAGFVAPKKVAYDPNAIYIVFLMLDYDGSAWANQMVPAIYDDPARGKLALNWCVNTALNYRVPHVVKYLYDYKTPGDFLGFSGDGATYVQVDSLINRKGRVKESGVPYYEKFAQQLNERYGVKYNVFYIEGSFNQEWAKIAARTSPHGFGTNLPVQQQLIDQTPVNYVESFHVSSVPDLEKRLEQIYAQNVENTQYQAEFYAFRCILMKPTMLYEAVNKAQAKFPAANVHIIDVDNFYKLLKHKLVTPFKTPYSDSAKVTCSPENSQGLTLIEAAEGSGSIVTINDYSGWQVSCPPKISYLYFAVDQGFRQNLGPELAIEIEYYDDIQGELYLEYNSSDETATLSGAYKLHTQKITLTGTKNWKSERFVLPDSLFSGRQNGLADFRFVNLSSQPFVIKKVTVSKPRERN